MRTRSSTQKVTSLNDAEAGRDEEHRSCGWCLEAAWVTNPSEHDWTEISNGSLILAHGTTTVDAELNGFEQVSLAALSVAAVGQIAFQDDHISLL